MRDERLQRAELFLRSLQAVHLVAAALHRVAFDLLLEAQAQLEIARRAATQQEAARAGLLQMLLRCLRRDTRLIPRTLQQLCVLLCILILIIVGVGVGFVVA